MTESYDTLPPERVPEVIAELRARMRWTRADVVRHSGISRAKVWNLERGRTPTDDELRAVRELATRYLAGAGGDDDDQKPVVEPAIEVSPSIVMEVIDLATSAAEVSVEPTVTPSYPVAPLTPQTVTIEGPLEPVITPWPEVNQALEPTSTTTAKPTSAPTLTRTFDDGVRRFSNSEVQAFKRCRRRWWLGWHRGLTPRVESLTGVRDVGNRIHRALQAYYAPEGQTRVDPRDALERALVEDWTTLTDAVNRGDLPPTEHDRFQRSADLERAMIEGYVEWLKDTGADENLVVVASETYLEAPLRRPGSARETRLIGKVDVRVLRRSDGVRLFLDHKTVGEFTTPAQTLHMNEQMLHYHTLEWLNDDEASPRCDGALYNMLRRVKRTATANPPFYQRIEVRHNVHELQAYLTKLDGVISDVYAVEERLVQLERDGDDRFTPEHNAVVYPTMRDDCRWSCPFFSVCPMLDDGSRAEAMLERHYVRGDPLAYYQVDTTIEKEE